MLQIRLSKPAGDTGESAKPAPVHTVTVACPDHLVLADLPVAKSLGSPSPNAVIKNVGRRSRRQLGERVHFCVSCDNPIAIYGRLSPCEHAFCLDCARSSSLCYICYERIQKIQTIKMLEGLLVCAAPHCFKSFLKKTDFESHIHESHADLLHPNKEGNESEATSLRKFSASESTVQASQRPGFSPPTNSQVHDREPSQSRDQPSSRPVMQPRPMPPFPDSNQFQVFDQSASRNRFPQSFDPQGGPRQDSVPSPQFVYAPYAPDGTQQFFGSSHEMGRPDSTAEAGSKQGPITFQPGPAVPISFSQNYPQPWNIGIASVPLEPPMLNQGTPDGFVNVDPQSRGFFPGDYGQIVGNLLPNLPPSAANIATEQRLGANFVDHRGDGKSVLAHQPVPLPPPPIPPPPHLIQLKQGRSYSGDENHDAPPGFCWQPERCDSFGGVQD